MKAEIKRLWIRALKSRKYKQGYGALRTKEGYCCLGVLCDLHAKATGGKWRKSTQFTYEYLDQEDVLPKEVYKWAGLDSPNPFVPRVHLTGLNDDERMNFEHIANMIRRYL